MSTNNQKTITAGVWKTKDKGFIPMAEMTEEHLQKAFLHAAHMELRHHNKASRMGELMEELELVAKERGIDLKYPHELDGAEKYNGYFRNRKEYLKRKEQRTLQIKESIMTARS